MTSHGIRCQSVTLGNQKDVSGVRGSHWGLPDRKIGVEKIWLAEFRHEKIMIMKTIQDDFWCILVSLEASWKLP